MQNLILVGGGGHCKSVIEAIVSQPESFKIKGILDSNIGETVSGYSVIGSDELIPQLVKENAFVITVGSSNSTKIREKIADKVTKFNGTFATVVSKKIYCK